MVKPSALLKKNTKPKLASTVALGRLLSLATFSQLMKRKYQTNSEGTGPLSGAIITVVDTKGKRQLCSKPGADIKKTATGEVLVGLCWKWSISNITDYSTGNPITLWLPISGEIGEDLAFTWTESQQTPSVVGLNVLWTREDKVKVAGFLVQVLPGAKEEEIVCFEKRIQEMPAISTFSKVKTISKPSSKLSTVTRPYKLSSEEEIRFQCDCSRTLMNALASLPSQTYRKWKRKTTGRNHLSILPNNLQLWWKRPGGTHSWQILIQPFMIGNVEIPNRTV